MADNSEQNEPQRRQVASASNANQTQQTPEGQTTIVHGQRTEVTGDYYNIAGSMQQNITVIQRQDENNDPQFTVEDLAEELKTHYQNQLCQKQLYPWESGRNVDLHDIYVQLTVDKCLPKPCKTIKKPLQYYHKIFEDTEEQRRFILEGRPGLGKSTLCAKIAHDWCHPFDDEDHNHDNIPLNRIELLFVLELGKVNCKSNIEAEIIKQLLHASGSRFSDPQRLREMIEKHGKSVVIVFDALDESNPDLLRQEVGNIGRILKAEDLSSCRVLVTSRPCNSIEELMDYKYRRLELQPFTKEKILEYVKKFFGVDELHSLTLGACLSRLISNNELIVDVSIPLIALLICWYWQITDGDPSIPRRRSKLYDAIITKMHQSRAKKYDLNILVQNLGYVAMKGLEPAKTPQLVFPKHTISEEVANDACILGLVSLKGNQADSLTFFHKSGQEHIAGKYLADHSEDLRSYLKCIRTINDAMTVGLVLISTAATCAKAAGEVMTTLTNLFVEEIDYVKKTMRLFYDGKLPIDETRRIQQFIELCVECNYEADAKGMFNEMLQRLFVDGQVYCFGIQSYPAVALGYYMKHCDSWIRSFKLQPVAHPTDPLVFYGPCKKINEQALKDLKNIPEEEVLQLSNDYKREYQNVLHEDVGDLSDAELLAYTVPIQRCEGLPSMADTNIVPIIKGFQHLKLEKLEIDNFKLGRNFDDFVKSVTNGHMKFLAEFWAPSVTSTGAETTQLAEVVENMPALKILGIHRNKIEPGKTLRTLAQSLASCKDLQTLHVSDYNAPAVDMKTVVNKLPSFNSKLQEFVSVNNHMNDDVASGLSQYLPRTLTKLGISVCELSRQKHRELLTGLYCLDALEKLRLKDSPYPSDMVECVGTGLTSWSNLKELTLTCKPDGNRSGDKAISADVWKKMSVSLKDASHLQGIRFWQIRLGDKSFTELCDICKEKNFKYLRYTRACLSKANEDLCNELDFVTID